MEDQALSMETFYMFRLAFTMLPVVSGSDGEANEPGGGGP